MLADSVSQFLRVYVYTEWEYTRKCGGQDNVYIVLLPPCFEADILLSVTVLWMDSRLAGQFSGFRSTSIPTHFEAQRLQMLACYSIWGSRNQIQKGFLCKLFLCWAISLDFLKKGLTLQPALNLWLPSCFNLQVMGWQVPATMLG